jgi:hypothetical protein
MTIQVVVGALGALLLVAGVLGGGLELREIKIPQIGRVARASASVLGLLFVGTAVALGASEEAGPGSGGADAETKAYQQRVRSICNEDRDQEIRFNRDLTAVSQQLEAGDSSATEALTQLIYDVVDKQSALKGELEALNPPSELDATHNDAVAVWDRALSLQRTFRDDVMNSASDPEQLVQVLTAADSGEDERLSNEADVYLRRLAGSGCHPAP